MFRSGTKDLENAMFNLRFASKQLARQAVKAEKDQKAQEQNVKKAIEKGNQDGARIYAENAIRKKQEGLNYLRMSSRLDATAQRVQTAVTMKQVQKSMTQAVRGMDKALKSMDLAKITELMDKFESQFEDVDVQTGVMENAMGGAVTTSVPEDQVESLIQQVADEHGLEVSEKLNAPEVGDKLPKISTEDETRLNSRLKALRDME